MCYNSNAMSLIEKRMITHPEELNWTALSCNKNAFHLLEKRMITHPEDLNWKMLRNSPNALYLFKKMVEMHPDKLHLIGLSQNRYIFSGDAYHKACRKYFHRYVFEELVQVVWHPKNIHRFASLGEGLE